MDLQKHFRGALALAVTLTVVALPAFADTTVWLVRPLYPGQEALVERTEQALDRLMPGEARKSAIIGRKELAQALKGSASGELPCFGLETRCGDPIDPFVASLGFDRVVLIQGGQDEAGFKYRVTAYEPKTGKVSPASATNANLEKALLGAVAKVVPAASTLDVNSTPAGATVFIDDVKVGVTPLNTQVLPGERVIRIDLKLHQPIEETIVIPIRGTASLEKTLEKVAARIVITASPPGTEIFIDGASVGKDKVDRGIVPGDHTIRLTAENHKAFEQTVSVKADQQYSLDKTLEPTPGTVVAKPAGDSGEPKDKVAVVVRADDAPPKPPAPATPEDLIYERRSYFHASFEVANFTGENLVARRFDTNNARTTTFKDANGLGVRPTLIGASAEYGTFGKYFGVTVFGLTYLTNLDNLQMNVGYTDAAGGCETSLGVCKPAAIGNVRTNFVIVRALHPQVRVALWRFQLSLQVGLEFRTGQITGTDEGTGNTSYKDGFIPLEMLVAGRFNVRFLIVDGLFLHLQANYTQYLLGERSTDDTGHVFSSASSFGGNVGFGYGF